MKNTLQKGFIIPIFVAIIAVLALGGGAYIYHEKKQSDQMAASNTTALDTTATSNTSATATVQLQTNGSTTGNTKTVISSKVALSDTQIETATFANLKIKRVGTNIVSTNGTGNVEFNGQTITRGDLNGDGLEDAVVLTRICGAGCFGYYNILIVININGTARIISPNISNKISLNLDGKTDIQSISVNSNKVTIIYTNGSTNEAKTYQLQGNVLVELTSQTLNQTNISAAESLTENDIVEASYSLVGVEVIFPQYNKSYIGTGLTNPVCINTSGKGFSTNFTSSINCAEVFWISNYNFTDSSHTTAAVHIGGGYGASGHDDHTFKIIKTNGKVTTIEISKTS